MEIPPIFFSELEMSSPKCTPKTRLKFKHLNFPGSTGCNFHFEISTYAMRISRAGAGHRRMQAGAGADPAAGASHRHATRRARA